MNGTALTKKTVDVDFIPGISDFCDRWCERCPLSARCLLYTTGIEQQGKPVTEENEELWRSLQATLERTKEIIAEWARDAGVKLDMVQIETRVREPDVNLDAHGDDPLARAGSDYADLLEDWLLEHCEALSFGGDPDTQVGTSGESFTEVVEEIQIVRWYQFLIPSQIARGLACRKREAEALELSPSFQRESDGGVKVALLGIDRSLGAWQRLREYLPHVATTMDPLVSRLEELRYRLETFFPGARDFIRPGLDERLAEESDALLN